MKLEEAIKANEAIAKYPSTPIGLHTLKAIKLGIEALKLEQEARADLDPGEYDLLPGETKE